MTIDDRSSLRLQLLLMSVLNCVFDAVSLILRKNVEKRALFENLDIIMLAMDEICDGGIVLESDPNTVVNRVALRTDDIPLGEQTVAQVGVLRAAYLIPQSQLVICVLCFQVLQSAKEQLKWSLLK